jgi:SOS-response transcriptional repressor LexA
MQMHDVIVTPTKARKSVDIVVCVNDGMALIKKMTLKNKKIILQSLNSDCDPIIAMTILEHRA